MDRDAQHGALAGLCRVRRGVPRFRPGARHAQGVRAERDARQAAAGQGQGALREHDGRARDQYAGPGYHGYGHRGRRGGGPRLGRLPRARRGDGLRRARHRAHARRRGLPAAARAAHAFAPGHARHLGIAGRFPDPRRRAPGERPSGRRGGRRAATRADRHVRGRALFVSGRAATRARRLEPGCSRGRAGGHRRAERLGQVHRGAPAAALLRSRPGPCPGWRPRRPGSQPRPAPEPHRGGEPGHLPLPRHRGGEPAHGQARRDAGRAGRGRARRQCGGVHRALAAGLSDRRGRARGPALGRPTAAHRHRAGAPAGCAHPGPGRGALGGGRGERGGDPGGARPAHAGAHDADLRASPVERDRRRPHLRPRRRARRGDGHAHGVDGPAWGLSPAHGGPGAGRRPCGGPGEPLAERLDLEPEDAAAAEPAGFPAAAARPRQRPARKA